jgi:hypothetical protein
MAIDKQSLCGAVYDPAEEKVFRRSLAIKTYQELPRESGRGKKRFLWQFERTVFGRDFEETQTIGDCVSKGIQRAALMLWCIQIALKNKAEKVPGIPASEPLYGFGRNEIGRGRLGSGDGLVVSWGIKGAMQYGFLLRQKYGTIDLSVYDGQRAKAWGRPGSGVPDELEPFAREFPLLDAAPITSWDDGCDALYNGEVLVGGSNSIFESRGSDGYLVKTMSGGHCTTFIGYDDSISKPYWVYDNGSWPRIPGARIEDCPPCAGPIIRNTVERMLDEGEWYAVSSIKGMPAQSDDLNTFEMI